MTVASESAWLNNFFMTEGELSNPLTKSIFIPRHYKNVSHDIQIYKTAFGFRACAIGTDQFAEALTIKEAFEIQLEKLLKGE